MSLTHFFLDPAVHGGPVHQGSHEPWLVLLSIFVAIFAATMALRTAQTASSTQSPFYKGIAVLTGAFALGSGVWSMHFIGMLALKIPAEMSISTGMTLLSFVPVCVAAWLAFHLLTRHAISFGQLVAGGMVVGLGVGAMHYLGMLSIQSTLEIRHDPMLFAAAVLLAITLAPATFWLWFRLQQGSWQRAWVNLIAGCAMGLSIAIVHYVGMAGVVFLGEPGLSQIGVSLSEIHLALILSCISITLTIMVVALNSLIRSYELNQQIREGSSRLQATLDTAVDGIITIDSKGLIRDFNRSAERLFGWQKEEVIGRNVKMLMPEPYQSAHDGYLNNYMTTRQPKIIGKGREVIGLRKDGSQMPMRLAVGRMELPDELLFVGFVSDISDRHALEASLRETAERAEQAAAAKSIFLANMSHEIRTPMNSIIGFSELLLQTELSPSQRNHLGIILQSSRSLLRLINDVLDTTKMEKGKLDLENIDFSMRSIAMQVESSLRLDAQSKQLNLIVRYPDDMPKYFEGDPLRLMQVLNNLVGNAIKFTEKGKVEVAFSYDGEYVQFEVIDTGIGMTPAQVETIFSPFTQADASISRRFGGTGLGTTIARQLVKQMGGDIKVESALGLGSTFRVRIPLPLGKPPQEMHPGAAQVELPPLRILIADDVPQNLELLGLILEQGGHIVTSASDGGQAVDRYTDGAFDLVLMDVHMPGVDGLQATRLIRQFERNHGRTPTPIVALTASVMAEDRQAARQAGMDGFALKPIEPVELFDEMARVLDLSQARKQDHAQGKQEAAPLAMVVDWAAGTAMWGDKERLAGALKRFLDSADEKYPLPHENSTTLDLNATLFSLHGLRGAAGNLSLPTITQLSRSMEQELRLGNEAYVREHLPRLRAAINEARQVVNTAVKPRVQGRFGSRDALDAYTGRPSPNGAESVYGEAVKSPGSEGLGDRKAVSREHLNASLQALHKVISGNELNDELLNGVCESLELQGSCVEAVALRAAVEAFEFRKAAQVLEQIMAADVSTVTS